MSLYVLSANTVSGICVLETLTVGNFIDNADSIAGRFAEQNIEFDRVEDFYSDLDGLSDDVTIYCVISSGNPYLHLMKKEYGVNF